jgi:hypothetical protein
MKGSTAKRPSRAKKPAGKGKQAAKKAPQIDLAPFEEVAVPFDEVMKRLISKKS